MAGFMAQSLDDGFTLDVIWHHGNAAGRQSLCWINILVTEGFPLNDFEGIGVKLVRHDAGEALMRHRKDATVAVFMIGACRRMEMGIRHGPRFSHDPTLPNGTYLNLRTLCTKGVFFTRPLFEYFLQRSNQFEWVRRPLQSRRTLFWFLQTSSIACQDQGSMF
jgi:hypothetical protein